MKHTNKILVLIALMIGMVFAELDETVISTAMPTIIRELHDMTLYGWVAGIYMLTMTACMPIMGKLSDIFGRKRLYQISIALFIVGSLVSGFAPTMELLLVGRGIQGVGAGGLMPLAMVIFAETFTLEQRVKLQGLFGIMMILPQLVGPMVGGFVVDHISWHWVFLINLPVSILAALLMFLGLHEEKRRESHSIDYAGALTLMGSILSLLLAPVLIENKGLAWTSPLILALIGASAVLLVLFILVERRAAEPIIPLRLLRNRNIVAMALLMFTVMCGIMGAASSFPYYAQIAMGFSATVSGYFTLMAMVGAIPISIACGFLITRMPYRTLFIVSFLFPVAGLLLALQIQPDQGFLYPALCFFIMGIGTGTLMAGDTLLIQESAEEADRGVAQSTVQLFQTMGASIGMSAFGSILAGRLKSGIAAIPGDNTTFNLNDLNLSNLAPELRDKVTAVLTNAFHHQFGLALVFAVAAVVICFFFGKGILGKESQSDPNEVPTNESTPAASSHGA
ncbi:EmrB/QacA subfamily drug resistance transporter [Paenibacillus cellulosilyticus]|uniref:MFS-type drug efflux transporter P55 n=1 Tax=Paenibacillus cellulosilyticus TaxID=375489 RepID=A0A2V2YPC6_9BACL|nr:MDR family MFS transporter [Paenibacillus cellulosilyticus]PWV94284.1 EmrB/QacA subfamily drug resistance transporter [Paenibacillus cellulosilyticus]QKS44232.1 MFS transporter [Paenibacillus cellulosilyticus]